MIPIKDKDEYLKKLKLTLDDKLFFLDFIDLKDQLFFDFGAADGFIGKNLLTKYPEIDYICYDKDPNMAKRAMDNLQFSRSGIIGSNLKVITDIIHQRKYSEKILFLSSVMHEIISYGGCADLVNFIKVMDFDTIIIRDMHFCGDESMKDTVETELKQLHQVNAAHEKEEEYFAFDDLHYDMLCNLGYLVDYEHKYRPFYLEEEVLSPGEYYTHIQLVLKKI